MGNAGQVSYVAAKAGHWGSYQEYFRANVQGTRNVLAACQAHGVGKLVYTSTPSVVHEGGDLEGVDERMPYARRFLAHYPATKAIAEREVLAANGPALATVALRPHLIWGPGDNHLLPRILERARAGRLRFVGKRGKRIDTTYIDNAVDAHLKAAAALRGYTMRAFVTAAIVARVEEIEREEREEVERAPVRATGT